MQKYTPTLSTQDRKYTDPVPSAGRTAPSRADGIVMPVSPRSLPNELGRYPAAAKSWRGRQSVTRRAGRSVLGWGSILIGFLLTACGFNIIRGSGIVVNEARNVSDFDSVVMGGSGEVVITQSGDEALTVEAEDNIMQYVTSEVRNGTLFLGIEGPNGATISTTRPIRYILNVDDLVGLKISGSGSATTQSLETSRLELVVSGSGDVRIDSLIAETADVLLSGSGEVELMGQVEEQVVDINGSADYNAEALGSDIASLTISGSGWYARWEIETSLQ